MKESLARFWEFACERNWSLGLEKGSHPHWLNINNRSLAFQCDERLWEWRHQLLHYYSQLVLAPFLFFCHENLVETPFRMIFIQSPTCYNAGYCLRHGKDSKGDLWYECSKVGRPQHLLTYKFGPPDHIHQLQVFFFLLLSVTPLRASVNGKRKWKRKRLSVSRVDFWAYNQGHFTHEPRGVTMNLSEPKRKCPKAVPTHLQHHVVSCGHGSSSVVWSHMWPGPH